MQKFDYTEINTERLLLRTLTDSDAGMLKNLLSEDYENEEAALEHIRWINSGVNGTRLIFNLFIWPKQVGQCVGRVYLHSKPEIDYEVEIGYFISEEHRNNGYVTEAAKAIIQFAFEKADQEVLVAIIHSGNAPSQRVIRKLGFTNHGVRDVLSDDGEIEEMDYFRLYRDDWQASAK